MLYTLSSWKLSSNVMVKMQVRKREKMAKLREEIAVQKAKETELNKTIHITGSFLTYYRLYAHM